jgi:hypothetical protein
MIDPFTAQVVFTNAAETALFVRLVDISGGEGRPVIYAGAPVHFSAGVAFAANTTNQFIRPDGGTNTIKFDSTGNMLVRVNDATALTIRTNGNVGIGNAGNNSHSLLTAGAASIGGVLTATRLLDSSGGTADPSGDSLMTNMRLTGWCEIVGKLYLGTTNAWLWSDGNNLFFSTSVGAGVTNAITSN